MMEHLKVELLHEPFEVEDVPDKHCEPIKTKCGEIFINKDEQFNFLCTFCGTLLEDINVFEEHVKIKHLNQRKLIELEEELLEESEMKIEPCSPRSDNLEDCLDISNAFSNSISEEPSRGIIQNLKHSDKSQSKVKIKSKKSKKINTTILNCNSCNKTFNTEKRLTNHMMYDHIPTNPFLQTKNEIKKSQLTFEDDDDNDDNCEINVEQGKLKNNVQLIQQQNNDIDPLTCRYCGKKLPSKQRRYEHECLHTNEKSYECEICNKKFRQVRTLNAHLEVHRNERAYKCDICGIGFNNKSNLNVHIRQHNGDKRYKCNYCEKFFITTTTRKVHERTHTGERPYQCTECGNGFTTSSKLNVHRRRRHTGERPYKCKNCNKSFSTRTCLKEHQVIYAKNNRPFKCDVCDATFRTSSTLRQHKKIHSNVVKYICDICGKGFKQHPGLYCHKKSHGIILGNK